MLKHNSLDKNSDEFYYLLIFQFITNYFLAIVTPDYYSFHDVTVFMINFYHAHNTDCCHEF